MMLPTHRLKILDKENGNTNIIGAGWKNHDGSISITIAPGIALDYDSCKNKVITLFPIDKDYAKKKKEK